MSIPLNCGISTSDTMHAHRSSRPDERKLRTEANVLASAPKDRTRLARDSRTDSSSSMIEIRMLRNDNPQAMADGAENPANRSAID